MRQIRGLDGLLPEGVTVIGFDTALAMPREAVREQVRKVAREVLACMLACPLGAVELEAQAGQPLCLTAPAHHGVHLSVSHAPGLSLLAISRQAQVGVDLMLFDEEFNWINEHAQVAHDYLGPASMHHIDALPPQQQQHGFAMAWTSLEASLKLHALPLQEWHQEWPHNEAVQQQSTHSNLIKLELPAGMVGTLATSAKQGAKISD